MDNREVIIDVSEIWIKYQDIPFEQFLHELIFLLKTYIKNIENSFGDYAKNEYDIIVNQLSNSDNESNFNLNFEDLYEWSEDYEIKIKISKNDGKLEI